MVEPPKPHDTKTWAIVTIAVAAIGCIGLIGAAFVGVLPDIIKATSLTQPVDTSTPIIVIVTPTENVSIPPSQSFTLFPTTQPVTLSSPTTFESISLQSIANMPLNNLMVPLSGDYTFQGIPFKFLSGDHAVFISQNETLSSFPQKAILPVAISHPLNVYLLLNGGYVSQNLEGKTAGKIVLTFDDGTLLNQNLIVGQNLREDWGYVSKFDDTGNNPAVTEIKDSEYWRNVYRESQSRGGKPAFGYIDMVTIPIPEAKQTSVLIQIDIIDLSIDNFGLLSPSIKICAITVETNH